MNAKFKFRLYPTKAQEELLWQFCGAQRFVWNYFLAREKDTYEQTQKFNFVFNNNKELTKLKKDPKYAWMKGIPRISFHWTLDYLDKALRQSFPKNKSSRKGFPKFKKRKNFVGSFTVMKTFPTDNWVRDNRFFVMKLGEVKCKYTRLIKESQFKTATIKCEANKWFVVLTCEVESGVAKELRKSIGIDINSKEFVLSNGIRYEIPKYLRENQSQIKKLSRNVSRKQKGSNNRKKAQLKLARKHWHVKMKRLDFFHKLSRSLVNDYDLIYLEGLNVAAMSRWNGHMIQDNGFSVFRSMIQYKSELYGKKTILIDRFAPSSKTCSECGTIKSELLLSERIYHCDSCGHEEDRDLNAAKNILQIRLTKSELTSAEKEVVNSFVETENFNPGEIR